VSCWPGPAGGGVTKPALVVAIGDNANDPEKCGCSTKGVDYPASKDELASHAEGNGADRELVEALRGMSKNSFDGPNAVMKELKGSLTGSND
jgi:hypothetical protein